MAGRGAGADTGAMESTVASHKLFVVEDAPSIRARLIELLDEIDDVCVVGEAESPAAAVAGIFRTRPHCVVLDFRLTGGTGVDVLRAVHPASPEIGFNAPHTSATSAQATLAPPPPSSVRTGASSAKRLDSEPMDTSLTAAPPGKAPAARRRQASAWDQVSRTRGR